MRTRVGVKATAGGAQLPSFGAKARSVPLTAVWMGSFSDAAPAPYPRTPALTQL
jgi:hypothetical protein